MAFGNDGFNKPHLKPGPGVRVCSLEGRNTKHPLRIFDNNNFIAGFKCPFIISEFHSPAPPHCIFNIKIKPRNY